MAGAYVAKPPVYTIPDYPPGWNVNWPFPGPFPPGFDPDEYEWPGEPEDVEDPDDPTKKLPHIRVYPISGLETDAHGGDDEFWVVLSAKPNATITIPVVPDTAYQFEMNAQGQILDANLEFNSSNWSIPQRVRVIGKDDRIADGDTDAKLIVGPSASSSVKYTGMYGHDVAVTNKGPEIIVDPTSGLITTEGGKSDTFSVHLNPNFPLIADVIINVLSSDETEGTASPSSLVFTPGNFSTPQTVTVSGVSDEDEDGDVSYTINLSASISDDEVYNGISVESVSAVNKDVQVPGIDAMTITLTLTDQSGEGEMMEWWNLLYVTGDSGQCWGELSWVGNYTQVKENFTVEVSGGGVGGTITISSTDLLSSSYNISSRGVYVTADNPCSSSWVCNAKFYAEGELVGEYEKEFTHINNPYYPPLKSFLNVNTDTGIVIEY